MKKFSEYVEKRFNEDLGPSSISPPENGMAGAVDDLQVKSMIKKRLGMFFDELQGQNISRSKSIQMLALVLQEFQQEFNLNATAVRQAVKQSQTQAQMAPSVNSGMGGMGGGMN